MPQAWTCPACGTRNPPDAAECSSCGRWASIFDLERTTDVDEPETSRAYEPEPVLPSGQRPSATELARSVLDSLREGTPQAEPEVEETTERSRPGSVVKWIVIALALLWFVLPPLLDALR